MLDTIAKHCYFGKQPIACGVSETQPMVKKSAGEVLSENLTLFMAEAKMTQAKLAKESGVGQTTISLYQRPDARTPPSLATTQ
jgi:DNA-binding XRE family transcriptional regulator